MGRSVLVAVDSSPQSQATALWAVHNLAREGDSVHLAAVAPPPAYTMSPAAPIASAGAYLQVAALSINWEQQRKAEEQQCRQLLEEVAHKVAPERREALDMHRHVLPAAGGASGVAESLVAYAKQHGADLVVVGSRGLGAVKSTLMSLVGLGSVSGYLLHHLHCPVAICRGREADAEPKATHKVVVALDDSETSRKALEWAVAHALGPQDELHLVCVALPIPYPVSAYTDNHLPQPDVRGWRRRQRAALREAEAVTHASLQAALAPQVSPAEDVTSPPLPVEERLAVYRGAYERARLAASSAREHAAGALQVVAEDAAASEVLEADEYDAATQDSLGYAREIVTKAVDGAAGKVDSSRIFFKALPPEGGASDVGQSIVSYAADNQADLVVMGARGMGSWKRAIMSFVGLGSVSDWVTHHVECPCIIYKA